MYCSLSDQWQGEDKDVFSTNLRQQHLFPWVGQKQPQRTLPAEKIELERVHFVICFYTQVVAFGG